MTTLRNFEKNAKAAILDDVEAKARTEITPRLKKLAAENWRAYASENGYDIDFIADEAELSVDRNGDTVRIRVEWPGLTALFEWGVDPHTIDGNPLLHFYWEAADRWIQTNSVNWGSETGGIPEARAIRDSIDQLERELQ